MGNAPGLVAQKTHNIEAVIDRVVVREGVRDRIAESINLAVRHGDGLVLATHEVKTGGVGVWHDRLFSTQYACPNCKISYEELEPRTFSFNSPYGACPACEGLGSRAAFDPELVLPNAGLSLAAGAIAPWKNDTPATQRKRQNHLRPFLEKAGIRWNTPLDALSAKLREQLLHGSGKRFAGVLAMLEKEYATTASESKRQQLEAFRSQLICKECGGARLRPEARSVRIAGRAIHEVTALTIGAAREFFDSPLPANLRSVPGEGSGVRAEQGSGFRVQGSGTPNLQISNLQITPALTLTLSQRERGRSFPFPVPRPPSPFPSPPINSRSLSRSSARSSRGWISWIAWGWAI